MPKISEVLAKCAQAGHGSHMNEPTQPLKASTASMRAARAQAQAEGKRSFNAYLPADILQFIDRVKRERSLSSRAAALEAILKEVIQKS